MALELRDEIAGPCGQDAECRLNVLEAVVEDQLRNGGLPVAFGLLCPLHALLDLGKVDVVDVA